VDALLAVYRSNPAYLALTEGSDGEPGRYDRGMAERDLAVARLTPGRTFAAIVSRVDGAVVGVLDWLDENPSDGEPWLGLVMVRADRQRDGIAAEAVGGLLAHLQARGAAAVRAGVIARNPAGLALLQGLGFRRVGTTTMRMTARETVLVLERRRA
jgi:RimJ/RimL family protein N-acetyltransferase